MNWPPRKWVWRAAGGLVALLMTLVVTDAYNGLIKPRLGVGTDETVSRTPLEDAEVSGIPGTSGFSEYVRDVSRDGYWEGTPDPSPEAVRYLEKAGAKAGSVWPREWHNAREPIISIARLLDDTPLYASQPVMVPGRVQSNTVFGKRQGDITRELHIEDLSVDRRGPARVLYCRYDEDLAEAPPRAGEYVYVLGIPVVSGTIKVLPSGRGLGVFLVSSPPQLATAKTASVVSRALKASRPQRA